MTKQDIAWRGTAGSAAAVKVKSPRERLLDVADRLLYSNGTAGVGIDRILEEAGVAKASLYSNFGSRDGLVDAYLKRRHETTMRALEEIACAGGAPQEKVGLVFDYLAGFSGDEEFRGCTFVLAALDAPDSVTGWRWAKKHKGAVRDVFRALLDPFELGDGLDDFVEKMMILYDGALITKALSPESNAVFHARSMAMSLLDGRPE